MARNKEQTTEERLQQFVHLFERKGWLSRSIGIRSGTVRYRLFCDDSRFFAYRMNESWGVPPGVPGWPVCLITGDSVFPDDEASVLSKEEPDTEEWLRRLTDNDFEVIQTP